MLIEFLLIMTFIVMLFLVGSCWLETLRRILKWKLLSNSKRK